jgi:hypothetical protein
MTARYRAAEAIWLRPEGHAGPKHLAAGDEFEFSGEPPVPAVPLNNEARVAKRKTLPDFWPANAAPGNTRRVGLGLGASQDANLGQLRATIVRFIETNPILSKETTPC